MSSVSMESAFAPLERAVSRAWLMMLLRGLAAIVFGVVTLAWPGISLLALVMLYGAYAAVDGITALAAAIRGGSGGSRLLMALGGIVSLAAAAAAFLLPGLTALTLVMLIGAWAVVRGVVEIAAGVTIRRYVRNEWTLIVAGVLSIVFGASVLAVPGAGALALLWLIGTWAIVVGVLIVALAFRLRRLVA